MLGRRIINTGSVSCTTDTAQILDPGTTESLALYRFEDNADDAASSTGKFGKGAKFPALASSYINTGFTSLGSNFSLSFWFNPDYIDGSSGYRAPLGKYWAGSGNAELALFFNDNGTVATYVYYGSGYSSSVASTHPNTVSNGNWYHYCITWENGVALKTYLNNVSATTTTSASKNNTNIPLYIGALDNRAAGGGSSWNSYAWSGLIDQVRVFNKAISASEVATLYNETTTTANTLQVLGDTSCIATYTLEGNANGHLTTTDLNTVNYPASAGCIALYELNGNATDTSNTYDGLATNITYNTGAFGKAAVFNGSNSAIQINNFATLSQVGVSLWVNMPDVTDQAGLITKYASNSREFSIYIYGGDLIANLYYNGNNGNAITVDAATYMSNNTWHHIAYTADGSNPPILWIDGVQRGTPQSNTNNSYYSTSEPVLLGSFGNTSAYYYEGRIDQVRIYNTALTQSKVTTLARGAGTAYNGGDYNVIYDFTGTESNITYAAGKFDRSAVLDGSSSAIVLPNNILNTNEHSISLWFNLDDTNGIQTVLEMDYENRILFRAVSTDSNLAYIGSVGYFNHGISFSAGQWYHLVITFSAGNPFKIYVDGVLSYTGANSNINAQSNDNILGAANSSGANGVDGKIDQVRIFNKSLSPGEINSLYNETATSAASATIDNPSTVAYYKMADGTDETGNFDGTATNVDFNVQGKYGFAGKFNGTSSIIKDVLSGFTYDNKVMTFSAWIKSSKTTQGNNVIIGQGISNSDGGWGIATGYAAAQKLSFSIAKPGVQSVIGSVTMNTGNWQHIVVIVDFADIGSGGTSAVKMYVDGVEDTGLTGNLTQNFDESSFNTAIGGTFTGSDARFFDGDIDQVRIFNKAISASEVTKLYNEIQCANTITTPEDYFNTKLYTGDGGTQPITGVGFAPGMTWIKARSVGYSHSLQDTLRGPGTSTSLYTDLNSSQGTYGMYGQISAFGTDGFTVASGGHGSYPVAQVNQNGVTYASWNWKAPSSNTTNNDGTIQSTVRASQESGFSIVKYTGNATVGATVGHGLGTKPEFILIKNLDANVNWIAYDTINNVIGYLDITDSLTDGRRAWAVNNTDPTSTLVTLGNNQSTNAASDFIMYCFHSVDGYQRIGSYIGNGSANGPFVYTGFEPAWVMIKNVSDTGSWIIHDNKRSTENPRSNHLRADLPAVEDPGSNEYVNFYNNGFQLIGTGQNINHSHGDTYLYLAIAANPDTTAPTKTNSFKTKLYSGNGGTQPITGLGFKPDLVWIKNRSSSSNYFHALIDSVRGVGKVLSSNTATVDTTTYTDQLTSLEANGFFVGNNSSGGNYVNINGDDYVSWNWKGLDHDRNLAAINTDGNIASQVSANKDSGFSIVKYTGNLSGATTATGQSVGHGLAEPPNLIIFKSTSNTSDWNVFSSELNNWSTRLELNDTVAQNDLYSSYPIANPTSSVFYTNYLSAVNVNAYNYIAYCWHSVAGYSSIGSYDGGTNGKQLPTGFKASWIMIKKYSSGTGRIWYIYDDKRDGVNDNALFANLNNAESSGTNFIDFNDTNIQINATGDGVNGSGSSYLYMAFK